MNQLFDLYNPSDTGSNMATTINSIAVANITNNTNSDWYTKTSLSNSVNPSMEERISLLPDNVEQTAPALIHIGESLPSLRTILKRFYPVYNVPKTTLPSARQQAFVFMPYLPPPVTLQYQTGTTYTVSPYLTTPVSFLSRMFAGVRGTMRYAYFGGNASTPTFVGRVFEKDLNIRYFDVNSTSRIYNIFNQYVLGGVNTYYNNYEPLVVDVPFQNYQWFYPTSKRPFVNAASNYGITFSQFVNDTDVRENLIMQSTGEDFQFVIYNGPPIVALAQLP